MYLSKQLSQVFKSSDQIEFDDSSKIILMSDCHRGDGSWADNFLKNQNLYFSALTHYYDRGYNYIEIGDGDELWENNKVIDIINSHSDVFLLLSKYFSENRMYLIYGNHDIVKKDSRFVENNYFYFYDEHKKKYIPLFKNIKVHEGLILKYNVTGDRIFLTHGHQVDFLNDKLWKLSRFLVRYLWKPLELFGLNDPGSSAKNYKKKEFVEKKLSNWALKENQMIISGHTHRPMFPEVGEPLYFNGGSCVHPHSITGIEIVGGYIALIKWKVKTKNDGTLFVGREIIAGPRRLKEYFDYK